jgi:hypothetical protein
MSSTKKDAVIRYKAAQRILGILVAGTGKSLQGAWLYHVPLQGASLENAKLQARHSKRRTH